MTCILSNVDCVILNTKRNTKRITDEGIVQMSINMMNIFNLIA